MSFLKWILRFFVSRNDLFFGKNKKLRNLLSKFAEEAARFTSLPLYRQAGNLKSEIDLQDPATMAIRAKSYRSNNDYVACLSEDAFLKTL